MTDQFHRDRLADTEKWLERFALLQVEIAMLKVAQGSSASKGHVTDELNRLMGQVREERERAMSELKTEMKAAFVASLKEAFAEHSKEQANKNRLYVRIALALIAVLLVKDLPSAVAFARSFLGVP